ncbi:MAG: outer membrane protein assembly factor BamA [Desulfovibrionaceae bacterium]|nr:outer membrane protein assembly factor BamA [Desulfovibrionaceae bacterium]
MTKLLRNSHFAIWIAFALLMGLFMPWQANAAGQKVLVLPFGIQSGPEFPDAKNAVPQSIIKKLEAQGMEVIPLEQAKAILRQSNYQNINLAAAHELGFQSGADVVVYGNFSQQGQSFTLNTMLVPVSDNAQHVPAKFQRSGLNELDDVAGQVASRVYSVLKRSQAPQPAAQSTPAPAPVSGQLPATTAEPVRSASDELVPMRASGNGISDIQIRGLSNIEPDVVLMRMSIHRGDRADAAAINEEVKRLWEMGYFKDVNAHMEGSVLVFDVVEKPRIENIIITGTDEIDTEDVEAAMQTRKGTVLNEQTLAEDLQRIKELYHKEGYYLAKPSYSIEQGRQGNIATLHINVDEGKKLYISEVKIDGLNELSQSDMESYMALRERNILSWITGTGVLKDEYLERDTNAIAAYALTKGYIDMQVSSPEVTYQEDGIHVIFTAHEGTRYNVKEVGFAGDLLTSEEEMMKLIEMPKWRDDNKYFNVTIMQDDAKALQNYYNDKGYAYAEVDTRVVKNHDEENTVNVVYVINKKQKVYIRRLLVEGNEKTRDNVILREMRLGDGDQYDGAKLRRSTERLTKLRYFKNVDTELVPTESDDTVDLKVKVQEGNTGAVMAGVGYSTYFDVGVNASIMERNLFGRGYNLALSGFFSWRRTSGTLTFNNPRLYDTNISFGNDLYYTHDYWDSFTRDTLGDTIRFGYPIGEYTSVGVSYRLENYEIYDVGKNASPYIRDYKGVNWTSALGARIVRDTTDNRERPSKGTILRLSGEWGGGGLGGTDNFFKVVGDWQGFYSIKENHTFHVRARLGAVFQNSDSKVPVFERFYVGGMDTVRGYSYTDASPRSRNPRYDNDVIGGDRMGVANFEYVWTFQKDLGLAIVPFFDIGFNYSSDDGGSLSLDFDKNWVYSAGLELRWRSPMGDLRIAYGYPLKEDFDGETETGRIEFSMGQFF